ncbi:MAG: S9 family peptidase [Calditrichaeota bacterium]|nr:S9 family peptidase [Calditrichota bacterium]
MKIRIFLLLIGIGIIGFGDSHASVLTPQQVVDLRWVTQVAIQPQGNFVAFTVRTPRDSTEKPGGAYNELWVVSLRDKQPRVYIRKPNSVRAIQWSPDGKEIYFLSRRKSIERNRQVYAIPVDGGEPRQITRAPRNVLHFRLSPDGKWLAYSMKDALPAEVKQRRKQGFDQKVEDTWQVITRLHVMNLETGESHVVTQSDHNVWDFDWTPDGQQLIYRASERPFTDDRYMFTDNYLVSRDGGEGQLIYDTEGKLELARVSPDGKYVAWRGAVDLSDPYPGSIFVKPLTGGEPKNLLEGFEGTAIWFRWLNKQALLVITIEKTHTYLYRIAVPSGKRKYLLGGEGPVFRSLSLAKDGKRFALAGNTYRHPNEVFLGKLGSKKLERLSNLNPFLENMTFGEQQTISWKGPDDLTIYGVLVKPVGYQKGQRYPLQVQVHGGPESAQLDGWNTSYSSWVQLLAQRGFMVLMPNYRGSIGRGVAFAKGDQLDLMGKEFQDILAGIDSLVAWGMVDPDRVGIGGGSYGGYTSAWAATRYSDRFKAAIVFAGISNQISKGGTTDIPAENALVHWTRWLYEDLDFVWDRSPLKYIANAKTPTLIAHGEKDLRVPVGQAYELYRGLKYFGVETELVVYPREPHGLRERAHQLDFCRRALEWYQRFLKKQP